MSECPYCHPEKEWGPTQPLTSPYDQVELYVDPERLIIDIQIRSFDYMDGVRIKFCPMCGRDLRKEG